MKNKAFEKLVVKSLAKVKYRFPEVCKRDVLAVLAGYRGLAPQHDTFVFDNGEEMPLLNVNGTIPIVYKGNTYNIPICFWLLVDYPAVAPMAYVKPTNDMQIKASRNVDQAGRISLPYLSEWNRTESNLVDLIEICVLIFGQSPPVFSKAKTSPKPTALRYLPHQTSYAGFPSSSPPHSTGVSRQASLQDQDLLQCSPSFCNGSREKSADETVSDKHLRISLVSAAEELVKKALEEEFMKTKAEVQALHSTNKELLDGQEAINDIVKDLEDKIQDLDGHFANLSEKERQLQERCQALRELDTCPVDVDEIVLVAPEDGEVLDAAMTDSALDDAIYTLGTALHQGQIEIDVYLKKVRNLSRKQFFQRFILRQKQPSRRFKTRDDRSDLPIANNHA